jgi:hypothetical protein
MASNLPQAEHTQPARLDYRDLVEESLAAALLDAERDREAYRELLQLALAQLNALTVANRKLQARVHDLLELTRTREAA